MYSIYIYTRGKPSVTITPGWLQNIASGSSKASKLHVHLADAAPGTCRSVGEDNSNFTMVKLDVYGTCHYSSWGLYNKVSSLEYIDEC